MQRDLWDQRGTRGPEARSALTPKGARGPAAVRPRREPTADDDHRHIRRLVAERRIPYIKWGHLLRFDPDEIDQWLARRSVPTEQ